MSDAETESKSPEQIETEIEQTRDDLGDTVEALARGTDVKAQAKAKAGEVKETAQTKLQDDPRVIYAGAGLLVAAVALIIVRRRR